MSVEPIPVDQPPDPVVVVSATEASVIDTPVPAYPEKISPDAPPRPVTRPNVLTICIVILTVCAVGAILTVLRPIITPVLIGVFLFFLVNPFIIFCESKGIPTWRAYVLIVFLVFAASYAIVVIVNSQGDALRRRVPNYEAKVHRTLDHYAPMLGMAREAKDADGKPKLDKDKNVVKEFDWERYGISDLLPFSKEEALQHLFNVTLETAEVATMAVFYLLFMLIEARVLPRRAKHSLQPDTAARVLDIVQHINADIWRYLVVKTAVSAGLGFTTAFIGMLFGLDFWPLWGLFMFLANYVTYVGSIVALGPPLLIAIVQFDSPVKMGVVIGLLVLSRVLWIDYVEIRYSGKHVNVTPLLLLFGLALMGWMWGIVGMLLAVPLITMVRIALGSDPRTEYLARMMSDVE